MTVFSSPAVGCQLDQENNRNIRDIWASVSPLPFSRYNGLGISCLLSRIKRSLFVKWIFQYSQNEIAFMVLKVSQTRIISLNVLSRVLGIKLWKLIGHLIRPPPYNMQPVRPKFLKRRKEGEEPPAATMTMDGMWCLVLKLLILLEIIVLLITVETLTLYLLEMILLWTVVGHELW